MSKSIFYCDIEGTFSPTDNDTKKRAIELSKFAEALDFLCESTNHEEMFFAFVSSSDIDTIISSIKEFQPYIAKSKHLKFGTSFGEHNKIFGNKISEIVKCNSFTKPNQIINNIHHILTDKEYILHENIDSVFFADDCVLTHKILSHTLSRTFTNIQLKEFIPERNLDNIDINGQIAKNLTALTSAINQYTNSLMVNTNL